MTVHIMSNAVIPNDGTFEAATVPAERAGVIVGNAIQNSQAELHILQRACADVLEQISGAEIGSQWLRKENQNHIVMDVGDEMLCATLNHRGRMKLRSKVAAGESRQEAVFSVADYEFVHVRRIA